MIEAKDFIKYIGKMAVVEDTTSGIITGVSLLGNEVLVDGVAYKPEEVKPLLKPCIKMTDSIFNLAEIEGTLESMNGLQFIGLSYDTYIRPNPCITFKRGVYIFSFGYNIVNKSFYLTENNKPVPVENTPNIVNKAIELGYDLDNWIEQGLAKDTTLFDINKNND